MNTKIVGILIIVLGLAGLFGGAYYVYRQMYYVPDEPVIIIQKEEEKKTTPVTIENKNSYNIPIKTENGSVEKIIELQKKTVVISGKEEQEVNESSMTEEQLKRTASLFIERFGSYSNQSNFSNVSDLKIYMSNNMKIWADDFLKKNNIDRDISVYYGITTKSISQKIETIDVGTGEASILVNSLRRESGGTLSEDNSFYQEVLVKFVLEKGFWKVDSANWR
ncbi:MAG: hypothetical protein PF572_05240 [Patescibacteria group bacterium]|jgi:hypothetical protein|nr:hypothetical protein [Patescibacteria group bacterium]